MIAFWIIAALLTVVALLFVLPPLLRRGDRRHPAAERLAHVTIFHQQLEELDADLAKGLLAPEDYDQGRLELECRLLDESRSAAKPREPAPRTGLRRYLLPATILAGLPAMVVALYYQVGSPQILDLDSLPAVADPTAAIPHAVTQEQVVLMTSRLAARLQKNPQDADGWAMLARSYAMMRRYGDSAAAYGKAAALTPDNVQLLTDYADTLAMAQGQRFEGKPADLIRQALQIDPNYPKALALAGTAAFEARSYGQAVEIWQHLLTRIPEGSPFAANIRNSIADARTRDGMAAAAHAGMHAMAGNGAATRGTVRLIPEMKDKVSPADTVFVFASPPEGGPKMPLAVMKRQVKDLPFGFALDDSMAVMPNMKMSNFKRVVIAARVSKSGKAAVEIGDFVSAPATVAVGEANVDLLIRGIVR